MDDRCPIERPLQPADVREGGRVDAGQWQRREPRPGRVPGQAHSAHAAPGNQRLLFARYLAFASIFNIRNDFDTVVLKTMWFQNSSTRSRATSWWRNRVCSRCKWRTRSPIWPTPAAPNHPPTTTSKSRLLSLTRRRSDSALVVVIVVMDCPFFLCPLVRQVNNESRMVAEEVTFDPFPHSETDTSMLFGDDYPLSYSYEILWNTPRGGVRH